MHEGRKSNWCEFETHGVMKENGKVLGVTSRLRSQEVLLFKFRNESTRSIWSTVVYFGLCQLPMIDLFCKKNSIMDVLQGRRYASGQNVQSLQQ